MKAKCFYGYALAVCLILCQPGWALEQVGIDFEGLSNQSELKLTNQIPGIVFEHVTVMSPAHTRSSTGSNILAATSGVCAASTFGARLRFHQPVVQVRMSVIRSFITVPVRQQTAYSMAYLVAYDQTGHRLNSSATPILTAVAEPEFVDYIRPAIIAISASVPIAWLTVDLDDPWSADGSRFLFDDLTLTVAPIKPWIQPSLKIERFNQRVFVSWDFASAQLQQTTNLGFGAWLTVPTALGFYEVDQTKSEAMLFRVVRKPSSQ